MLWLVLAVLTAGAVAVIVTPLLRPRSGKPAARGAFDRAVYKDQLAELERDRERGVLDPASATAARLEIERRLLATAAAEKPRIAPDRPVVRSVVAFCAAMIVAGGAVSVYLALGSPGLPDRPFASREAERARAAGEHEEGDLATTVDRLAAKLKENPQDAKGWLLLARSQAALQRWPDSAESYRRAVALTNAPEANSGYGEMLVMAANGIVTPAARDAFAAALQGDPGNVPARFYLALADAQAGKPKEALAAWEKLAAETPPAAPYQAMLRQQMAETARAAGIAPPAMPEGPAAPSSGSPGPSTADMQAAATMSPEARQKMIRSMVEGLAARLEKSPDDLAGWLRLARAYGVLGEKDKAADAAAHAVTLAPNDVEALLARARALIEAAGGGKEPRVAVPDEAVSLMTRVVALQPSQPDALWYLGLAAAPKRDAATATSYWRRLLGALPPDGDDHKMVQAALDALAGRK